MEENEKILSKHNEIENASKQISFMSIWLVRRVGGILFRRTFPKDTKRNE